MRKPRNLSGVFFRFKNPETDRFENWCYEDLPEEDRKAKLGDRDPEWVASLLNMMADTIVRLGDQFDIGRGDEKDEPA